MDTSLQKEKILAFLPWIVDHFGMLLVKPWKLLGLGLLMVSALAFGC